MDAYIKEKRRNQKNMQHREAELDQRWDRYYRNNTAMADLQISPFRARPFVEIKPKLQIHPSRYRGLDQYAGVSCYCSCLAQLSFSWYFHRNIQGYCRIISRLRVRGSSVWNIMNTCTVLGLGPRVGNMWGRASISITT